MAIAALREATDRSVPPPEGPVGRVPGGGERAARGEGVGLPPGPSLKGHVQLLVRIERSTICSLNLAAKAVMLTGRHWCRHGETCCTLCNSDVLSSARHRCRHKPPVNQGEAARQDPAPGDRGTCLAFFSPGGLG